MKSNQPKSENIPPLKKSVLDKKPSELKPAPLKAPDNAALPKNPIGETKPAKKPPTRINYQGFTPLQKGIGAILVVILIIFLWMTLMALKEVYVSDLPFTVVQKEWMEPTKDTSVDGNQLKIDNIMYFKGIGTHALSEISLRVPDGYTHFIAEVGVDDEIADNLPASVTFLVLGDGAVLYESPILKSFMPPYRVDVNVEEVKMLTLRVTNAGDGSNSDHADWGGARFIRR